MVTKELAQRVFITCEAHMISGDCRYLLLERKQHESIQLNMGSENVKRYNKSIYGDKESCRKNLDYFKN